MRKIILSILLSFICDVVFPQSISVGSFKLLESDLTANTAGTIEQDQNGEVAALIKVVTTQTGFTFDGGSLGIVKTKQTPGEVWVYVPRGSKKITIKHPQLGVLRDYYYPLAIDAARTYEMTLVSGTVQTIVKRTLNNQYLVIKVNPSDAVVELDNEILPTTDGVAQKFVKLGTYDYRIQAQDYHIAAGKVTVDDPNNKKILEINLQPAFGWIEIPAREEYNGAQVFIDNTLAGTIPMRSKNLASGEHNVKIVKALYNPFSQTVIVNDNETALVTPNLSANFSEVTITVDNDADIYVNDEKKGNGTWTGRLASGTYLMEAKKESHRSISKTIEISSSHKTQDVQLDTPTPIYGEVNISSTPAMAEVYIDGEKKGETPLYLPQLLIGNHQLVIKHDGYGTISSSFTNSEQEVTELSLTLEFDKDIDFLDEEVKKICIKNWDFNNDGKFTKDEAKRVTNLNKAFFLNTKIKDLNVLSFFENLKELNRNEFYYCRSLEQITLPLGLKTIGDSAFVKCRELKGLIIPHSVESIGSGIINECELLDQIVIPSSVKSIKGISIPWHVNIIFEGDVPDEVGYVFAPRNSIIKVRKEYKSHYKEHSSFKLLSKQIKDY